MQQPARAKWRIQSHSTPVCVSEALEVRIVLSLMRVPQVLVPMVLVVPIGIITTTAHAHLGIRERTVAMILMSAANPESVLMVASA